MDLKEWLSPNLLDKQNVRELHTLYKMNVPFPHLLIKDFLQEKQAKKLLTALKEEHFEKKQSDLFSLSQTQDFATTKQNILKGCYELFQSKGFIKTMSMITGLKLKKGAIDMAGSLYEDTDFLLCHDDQLERRKIAYIYYLSENFTESDGGALALLADENGSPEKIVQKYFPQWNSCIFFEVSRKSWHEVEEVLAKKKRYAIGGWLY